MFIYQAGKELAVDVFLDAADDILDQRSPGILLQKVSSCFLICISGVSRTSKKPAGGTIKRHLLMRILCYSSPNLIYIWSNTSRFEASISVWGVHLADFCVELWLFHFSILTASAWKTPWQPWRKGVTNAMGALAKGDYGKKMPWSNVKTPMANKNKTHERNPFRVHSAS